MRNKVAICSLVVLAFTMPSCKNESINKHSFDTESVSAAREAAFSVSRSKLRKLEETPKYDKVLTDQQLIDLLRSVGFKGESLRIAWAVAKAESGGDPKAFNGNSSTGDKSYGLFQINMIGRLGPERREKFGLDDNSDLLDALTNARIAYRMSAGGTNWKAWKYAKTKPVLDWVTRYPD